MLREVRLRLARERGVPPYVIFHDTTLRDMVERRPATIDDLHEIYGVGAKKAADFGDAFLDAIRTFRRPERSMHDACRRRALSRGCRFGVPRGMAEPCPT